MLIERKYKAAQQTIHCGTGPIAVFVNFVCILYITTKCLARRRMSANFNNLNCLQRHVVFVKVVNTRIDHVQKSTLFSTPKMLLKHA